MYSSEIIRYYFENGKIGNIELRNETLYEILGHNYRFGPTEKLINDLILVHQYFQLYSKRSDWDEKLYWNEDRDTKWFKLLKEAISNESLVKTLNKYEDYKKEIYFMDGILDEKKIKSFQDFWRDEFRMKITKKQAVRLLVNINENRDPDIIIKQIWDWDINIIKTCICEFLSNCNERVYDNLEAYGYVSGFIDDWDEDDKFNNQFKDYFTSYPEKYIPKFIEYLERETVYLDIKKRTNSWEETEFLKVLMKYTGCKFFTKKLIKRLEFASNDSKEFNILYEKCKNEL